MLTGRSLRLGDTVGLLDKHVSKQRCVRQGVCIADVEMDGKGNEAEGLEASFLMLVGSGKWYWRGDLEKGKRKTVTYVGPWMRLLWCQKMGDRYPMGRGTLSYLVSGRG
jgi:hypothetical protein